MQNNGSLWADVFVVRDGASPDPSDAKFDPRAVYHIRTREFPEGIRVARVHLRVVLNSSPDEVPPEDQDSEGEEPVERLNRRGE